ncbi:3-deoxy-manno-octulosonate cytidylyltransferase [Teredinibacter purpureus]|uniref:3-deoxy-manno-octulosonate cytidylyltransferase n=1 Tax=Teredinibacter purpureus TaxID=2731756 RepID=UPI0005F83043|nr:3-deoxy-manno-octulosonate cytidylyltransferase [Teredinibacter purpureus]
MSFSVVIPARYASQRLPGKPLVDIAGKTMIERVYRCAQKSDAKRVIVATDDDRVMTAVKAFGGEVCMTSTTHQSGTDRLEEVVRHYGLADDELVVNVQGDEPLIPAAVINQVARNLANNEQASAATLCEPIVTIAAALNPNAVKVVCNAQQFALYFSRAPIPWDRDGYSANGQIKSEHPANEATRRHIGIYAYRVKLLHEFVQWPISVLENIEKLEQLRILANGLNIHVEDACEYVPGGVDTQEDLDRVRTEILEA